MMLVLRVLKREPLHGYCDCQASAIGLLIDEA
jgi:hypothetical protein